MISVKKCEANMGGIGSGRYWRRDTKPTTSDYQAIDVRRWQRDGLLALYRAFSWQWLRDGKVVASIRVHTEPGRVILTYRHRSNGEDWKDENYPVYLDWTACNFGGQPPWFLWPAPGCGRRVAILYGGDIFACRHCYHLAYPSQRETDDDRAARRADRIREKLGWEPGFLNGKGWKPKGMHRKTFEKLTVQHDAYVNTSLIGISARLNLYGDL